MLAPLDFEAPLDADGDNIYEITVEITDGVNIVTEDITITVEDDPVDSATAKPSLGDQADDDGSILSSFEIIDEDDAIDLNAMAEMSVTFEDIVSESVSATDLPEVSFEVEVQQGIFEDDSSATDMQFTADLLLLQDSSAVIDG